MAGTAFDKLQSQVFAQVQNLFGYDASWTPLAGGAPIVGKVLLNYPTDEDHFAGQAGYTSPQWTAEYADTDFPGLRASCDTGAVEILVIDGTGYEARSSNLKFDGKTVVLHLAPA